MSVSDITLDRAESAKEESADKRFLNLSTAADKFEAYSEPHAIRIASLADELAKRFHLGRADRAVLRAAALAHDWGEMSMKREYIGRADGLSDEERRDLSRHPVIGESEAARLGLERGAQLIVRWHHEWWNGAGYPDALRGEEIPLAARILRVADSYAALTAARPFRPAMPPDAARDTMADWAGLEFDPHVVHLFLALESTP
jgi:HD-GYP domain-containing protein (c-di-GMP phosphodiesterase class II)